LDEPQRKHQPIVLLTELLIVRQQDTKELYKMKTLLEKENHHADDTEVPLILFPFAGVLKTGRLRLDNLIFHLRLSCLYIISYPKLL
jgi:hypothetical protein